MPTEQPLIQPYLVEAFPLIFQIDKFTVQGIANRAIQNLELFTSVAEHRSVFFNQNWMDYDTIQRGSLRLVPGDDQIAAWRQDYQSMQSEMFFGTVPDFYEIMRVVGDFQNMFNRG